MITCEYVRKHYGVPACLGRLITYRGKPGIISEDRGNYVGVTFDDEKPGTVSNIHPTDAGLEYGDMGIIRPMTRSQQRYRDYLRSEMECTFIEYLRSYA